MKSMEETGSITQNPIDMHIRRARSLLECGRRREALETAHAVAGLGPDRAEQCDALGTIFAFCGESEAALNLFRQVCAERTDNAAFLFNLATAERMNGLLQAAEETLDRVIGLEPDHVRAYFIRSDLRPQTVECNHVDQIEAALTRRAGGDLGLTLLSYALAKELDDLGEYRRAFAHLERGAANYRRSIRYCVDHDIAILNRIVDLHNEDMLSDVRPGFGTQEPIFIIGLPRSGTTLVDRILSSHPDVSSAGELVAFPMAVQQSLRGHAQRPISAMETVDRILEIDPALLGQAYLEASRPQTGHRRRFIDKLPINYLYVGIIHRALPQAKIILVRREPLDSCLAMFRNFLTGPYPFTNDLEDIARYFGSWTRLMDHWETVLGPAVLSVTYEAIVENLEGEARRLLDFCDLSWDPACLNSHKLTTPVMTASASQVRRPIYRSSVGKWRSYRPELEPMIHRLRVEGVQLPSDV